MLTAFLIVLDKLIIGLSGAALSGLFSIGAKHLFTNHTEEATDAMMIKFKRAG